MKTRFISLVAGFSAVGLIGVGNTLANGTVELANDSSCLVTNGQTSALVTSNQNIRAALYWAPTNSAVFTMISNSVTVGIPVPGIFAGGARTNGPATPGGHVGQFQVRAWGGSHATFEAAAAVAGTLVGTSAVLLVPTGDPLGDPPTPPASLVAAGLQGFTLTNSPGAENPLALYCATNKSVACGSPWDFDPPTTSNGCATVTLTSLSTVTNGTCPQIITRTWQATDGCETITCSQTVTNVDTVAPVITCAPNKTVACGSAWNFDPPSAYDACSGANVTVVVYNTVTNGTCPEVITRTWRATDPCGNYADCSQIVTVVDEVPPVLTCLSNKTVNCGDAWVFDEPTAQDDCSGEVPVAVWSTVTNGVCSPVITRIWVAVDACDNTNWCSQVVTIQDLTPPVLTCVSNKTVNCGDTWAFDEPTALDDCSGEVPVAVWSTVTNGVCSPVITRTWLAVDACDNTNWCSQAVTIVNLTPPTLACAPDKTVDCTDAWDFDPPLGTDGCPLTETFVDVLDTVTNSVCPLVVTRTWSVSTACETNVASCGQTVLVNCEDCPALVVTKQCPANPVPIGGTLHYTGTVTNASGVTLTNVVVVNDHPAPDTLVFGPATLAPGEGAVFGGSYSVPPCSCGPHTDTLIATGAGPNGAVFTSSATVSCPGTATSVPGDLNGDGIVDQNELNAVLANYWATSPWVSMTNAMLQCDGRFQFQLTNAMAWNFTVLVTTNLVDWTNLPAPAYPVYQFEDPEAPNAPQRIYRLQWP